MSESENILAHIRLSAAKKILFLPHAIRQMSKPERMISTADIRHVIQTGEIPEKEKTMKCMYCQGQMKKGTAPFHIDRHDYHLTLNVVPAWVCQQCGEVYFDESEVNSIQDIIKAIEIHKKRLTVAA